MLALRLVVTVMLLLGAVLWGSRMPVSGAVAYAKAAQQDCGEWRMEYAKVLQGVYRYVNTGDGRELPKYGTTGIYEMVEHSDAATCLRRLAYTLRDLNGDGEPELLIGNIVDDGAADDGLYAIYTMAGGSLKCVAEGWQRNSVMLLPGNIILERGSTSYQNLIVARNHLQADGSPACIDLYFSWPAYNNPYKDISIYTNKIGRCEVENSHELDMTRDELVQLGAGLAAKAQKINLRPLAAYPDAGFAGMDCN